MTLSVVLPASDDEKRLPESLRRIRAFLSLKDYPWEVRVCGTDPASIGQGMSEASGRYVLLTEAGLHTPIKEVDKLVDALEKGADVAVGSRALRAKDCDVDQSVSSRISEGLQNLLVRATRLPRIRDARCRFKCFRNDAAKKIFSQTTAARDLSGVQALVLASKQGLRIVEVPVMWSQESA